jgi:hypothetical protein
VKAKAKENHGLRIADSQSSHLLSELDINDRGCFGFRNFSRQRCPLVIAGGFIKPSNDVWKAGLIQIRPQPEEDRLTELVVLRPLREVDLRNQNWLDPVAAFRDRRRDALAPSPGFLFR